MLVFCPLAMITVIFKQKDCNLYSRSFCRILTTHDAVIQSKIPENLKPPEALDYQTDMLMQVSAYFLRDYSNINAPDVNSGQRGMNSINEEQLSWTNVQLALILSEIQNDKRNGTDKELRFDVQRLCVRACVR